MKNRKNGSENEEPGGAPNLYCVMNPDGFMIKVNPILIRILGWSENELLSNKFFDFVHPNDREGFRTAIESCKEGIRIFDVENRCLAYDSSYKWISWNGFFRPGDSLIYAVVWDNSRLKQAEEETLLVKNRAEEMNRIKSNFLANMSHELRTPLVALLGFSELLQSDLRGENKEYADMINASGMRLLKTLNEILDYSEIEAKKTEISLSRILINDILLNEIKLYLPIARQKGLFLKGDLCGDLFIDTDVKLFRRILDNLLNNAIKFTRSGGITISLKFDDDEAVIKVSDTGIGIPAGNLSIIFEEFRQVSEGLSRNFDGTGLGLTLVKKYVEMLNGRIAVKSMLGEGSEFTISLPRINSALPQKLTETESINLSPKISAPISRKPVLQDLLLVEDEELNAFVIRKMLEGQFKTVHVFNAKDAIEASKQKTFHIVLMDINLNHGMSGIEAVKEIRKIEGYADIPIVAMTAYAMQKDKEEFITAGCSHYLAKPFTRPELIFLLREIVG
jgi:PAS domain S-box-containing protein